MNSRQLELALRKQRLQFRCAEQRRELARGIAPLLPIFAIAETARSGARWVRAHPAISVSALAVLIVIKPRIALRWARRAWLGWLTWRKLRLARIPGHPPQAA